MGNSEVGHLNIGAGRVVEQWLLRIDRALRGNFLEHSKIFNDFKSTLKDAPHIHICGLLSAGGVHSHEEHLQLLIKKLSSLYAGKIVLHVFTDGRDCPPQSGADSLLKLTQFISDFPRCTIGSVSGRFFAMDRDKRWDRTEKAYRAIVDAQAPQISDPIAALRNHYVSGKSDEFFEPVICAHPGVKEKDAFLFFNFREDRMRQLTAALADPQFSEFARPTLRPSIARMLAFTQFDQTVPMPALFEQLDMKNHLGEYLSGLGLTQLRVAETEKYPHVTYFLNAGIEAAYPLEERQLVPSPRDVKTYDLKPEMSAEAVTNLVVRAIETASHHVITVNLANCDMVGHTGVFEAAVKAVETVDKCLGRMLTALEKKGGQALIIADHGNAEQMIDYITGAPHTAHTTYPVPCILVTPNSKLALGDGGALCDVAPTILELLALKQPVEMTGESLLRT
jgi:2,3-bisphosphoglycerate-independent phosphoglycerate mutase